MKYKLKEYHQQDKVKGRLHYVHFHGIERYLEQNITLNELLDIIKQNGLNCYLCDLPTKIIANRYSGKQLTLDRLDNSKNHSKDNVRICCLTCNIMRSNNYSHTQFKDTFF